jgi:lysyl-tRNA synthetase class 2
LDYPKAVPTLARSEGEYAQRWEMYIDGLEIANCYTEETSVEEIRVFFGGESRRKKGCLVQHRIDPYFPELFGEDYPECSGVALGIDRLFMVLCGSKSIDRAISFPFSQLLSL